MVDFSTLKHIVAYGVVAGTAILAPNLITAGTTASTVATAACADGDCSNEISSVANTIGDPSDEIQAIRTLAQQVVDNLISNSDVHRDYGNRIVYRVQGTYNDALIVFNQIVDPSTVYNPGNNANIQIGNFINNTGNVILRNFSSSVHNGITPVLELHKAEGFVDWLKFHFIK